MIKKPNTYILSALIAIGTYLNVKAQSTNAQPLGWNETVTLGKLKNGFTYVIMKTKDQDVSLRFVTKVGRMDESDKQIELTHLIEHMPFVGTKHFESPIDYFESRGIKFGENLNASTGPVSTNYYMTAPGNDDSIIRASIQFFRDLAQGLYLDKDKAIQQRDIILEEIRQGTYETDSLEKLRVSNLIDDKTKEKRAHLDVRQHLQNFSYQALCELYKTWYRPSRQSLIIVGNIDVNKTKSIISELFADLRNPIQSTPVRPIPIAIKWQNNYIAVTHNSYEDVYFAIDSKLPHHQVNTVTDLKYRIVSELYNRSIRERLTIKNGTTHFVDKIHFANYDDEIYFVGPEFALFKAHFAVNPKLITEGFNEAIQFLKKIQNIGFSADELKRSKIKLEQELKEATDNGGTRSAAVNLSYFLLTESFPVDAALNVEISNLISDITLEELNDFTAKIMTFKNANIFLTAPESLKSLLPTKKQIWNIMSAPLEDSETSNPNPVTELNLMEHPKTPTVDEKNVIKQVLHLEECTVVSLSNGIKVYIRDSKSTTRNKAFIKSFNKCGSKYESPQDQIIAEYCSYTIAMSGLADLTTAQLQNLYVSKDIDHINPYIGAYSSGITAQFESKSAETVLQAIHLYLTNVDVKESAIVETKSLIQNTIQRKPNHDVILRDSISLQKFGHHFNDPYINIQNSKIDKTKLLEIYRRNVGTTEDMTFVLSIDMDSASLIKLIGKYLGSIPMQRASLRISDPETKTKDNLEKDLTIHFGQEDKAQVRLFYRWGDSSDMANVISVNLLRLIIEDRLLNRLRNIEAATYYVTTHVTPPSERNPEYEMQIGFICSPHNYEHLISSVKNELTQIMKNSIDPIILLKAKTLEKDFFVKNCTNNSGWIGFATTQIQNNRIPKKTQAVLELIDSITKNQIEETGLNFINESKVRKYIFLPVSQKPR